MFGNLDIKLGDEKRKYSKQSTYMDSLEAYEGVVAATENLENTYTQLGVLSKTADNIEHSQSLASAVADKTGDNEAAIVVGRESLKMSLNMIGQGHLADEAYVGAESVTAGAESAGELLKAAWDKVKETAKKVWAWIKELITKVTNWILDIFGKKEDSAEKLNDMLKKLKENDKTKLEATEFSKDVQLRLAKEMPLLAAKKSVSSSDIESYIDESAKIVTNTTNDTIVKDLDKLEDIFQSGIDRVATDLATFESQAGKVNDKTGNELLAQVIAIIGSNKGYTGSKDDKDNQVEDEIGDFSRAKSTLIGLTPEKKTFLVVGLNENGEEAFKNVDEQKVDGEDMKKFQEYTSQIAKIVNGMFVKTVTIKIDDITDATDNADSITPLDFSECTSIVKKLKDTSKTLEKDIKTFNKDIETASKNATKAIENLTKKYNDISKDANKDVKTMYLKSIERVFNFKTSIAKAIATAMADTAKGIVRSKFSHIIEASASLYIKK